jgi:hypothetical protein
MIDAFVRAEGEPEVLMFSGGEPSIHPRILGFIAMARAKGIRHVVLNTNGIRLARDRRFAERLAELGTAIYLQFDGLREETHLALRGRDLRGVKEQALDACAAAGLSVTLVAAVERDVNEDELGDILGYGFARPGVRSVVFQPVTHAGRHIAFDPRERLTNSDVIHAIVEQMPETFRASDFFPVPCCFPTCRSVTYLLIDGDEVIPVPRVLNIEDHLDYITNRVLPDPSIRTALEKLWSASAVPGSTTTAEQLACATCAIDLPAAARDLAEKAFMIVIQDFQDAYTLNVKQLMKCCVEQLTPDGRLIPFCAYNSVGYREEIREQLTGVPYRRRAQRARVGSDPRDHGARLAVRGRTRAPGRPRRQEHGRGPVMSVPRLEDAEGFKACCADLYGSDLVALLLGPTSHPGGRALTRRLAEMGNLRADERVLDVASGPGRRRCCWRASSACGVRGDLSPALVARAPSRRFGPRDVLRRRRGGACRRGRLGRRGCGECALCTFPDKATAVVSSPGSCARRPTPAVGRGREPECLPAELATLAGRVAASPTHSRSMAPSAARGLGPAGLRARAPRGRRRPDGPGHRRASRPARGEWVRRRSGPSEARRLARSAIRAAEQGIVGYALITAERPHDRTRRRRTIATEDRLRPGSSAPSRTRGIGCCVYPVVLCSGDIDGDRRRRPGNRLFASGWAFARRPLADRLGGRRAAAPRRLHTGRPAA